MSTPSMLSVEAAEKLILEAMPTYTSEEVALEKAVGRILRENILPDRPLPPFDRVTMDGIAMNSATSERTLRVEDIQQAGHPQQSLKEVTGGCLRAMTGAMLPAGTDCVIPIEELEVNGSSVTIRPGSEVKAWRNVHRQGSDAGVDDTLVHEGTRLLPPHISTIASVGRSTVHVSSTPRVAAIATGDELVDLGKTVKPYQIRPSNSYGIMAGLLAAGCKQVEMHHIPDDEKTMTTSIERLLTDYDMLVLSGGVSMGDFDFVPKVLQAQGVVPLFHKVAQRPGKPFWFGTHTSGAPVFALPGNPVSALICFRRYVIPALHRAMKGSSGPAFAVLSEDIKFHKPLTYFAAVQMHRSDDGTILASPSEYHGSGDYIGVARSSGFVELAADRDHFKKGVAVPYYDWES